MGSTSEGRTGKWGEREGERERERELHKEPQVGIEPESIVQGVSPTQLAHEWATEQHAVFTITQVFQKK